VKCKYYTEIIQSVKKIGYNFSVAKIAQELRNCDCTYKRKGIASQLLDRVVNEARQYGCGAVHIIAPDEEVWI